MAVRDINLTLKEVKAPDGNEVMGLVIVTDPYACAAEVGDTLTWHIRTDLDYAKQAGERVANWTIKFFTPDFENDDGNKPSGWPFKKERAITTRMFGASIVCQSPPIVSKDKRSSKAAGKHLSHRYTYTVSAKIPFGDDNPSFPASLLPNGKNKGWYTITDDPEIYVDEC